MAALSPDVISVVYGVKITNTFITTLVIDVLFIAFVYYIHKHAKTIPGKIQSIVEEMVQYFYNLCDQLAGIHAKNIFPWVMTFFIVIFFTNLFGLLPGVGTIGFFKNEETSHSTATTSSTSSTEQEKSEETHATDTSPSEVAMEDTHGTPSTHEEVAVETTPAATSAHTEESSESHGASGGHAELIPLFRPATSDFNMTFALAFVSLIATHALSIKHTGIKDYISRYISLNPILLFVGALEFVSEFIKMFSLSFRLYGNIYAGEVALHTVSTLGKFTAFLAPIPFILLESIVAVVQALVFSLLTLVFMSLLIKPHHGEEH